MSIINRKGDNKTFILASILVIIGLGFFVPSLCQAANFISLSPSAQTLSPNQDFSLTLRVDSITNLFAIGFELFFDPGLASFLGASTTTSLLNTGASQPPSLLTSANPAGRVLFSLSRYNPDTGVSTTSTSTLAVLNFRTSALVGSTSSSTLFSVPLSGTSVCRVTTSGAPCTYISGVWQGAALTVSDSIPPSIPTGFTATAYSAAQINLAWSPSTDNGSITRYEIFRNSTSTLIATTANLYYYDGALLQNTAYSYFVRAIDSAENSSLFSSASATTSSSIDTAPPTISNPTPNGSLSSDTTQVTLSVTTDESAICKYSTTASTSYNSMVNLFTTTTGTSHAASVSNLTAGASYSYYVRCADVGSNINTTDSIISFSINPVASSGSSGGGGGGGGGGSVSSPLIAAQSIASTICTSWTYSSWGDCQPDGRQFRTLLSSSPSGCVGGDPVSYQNCSYTGSLQNTNIADTKPADAGTNSTGSADSDGDGLSDLIETAIGTNSREKDTDGDGFDDLMEVKNNFNPIGNGKLPISASFTAKHFGKIFLQVESKGESWYINPASGKRHYLGRPADAFRLMRKLGSGIKSTDLNRFSKTAFPNRLVGRIMIVVDDKGKAYYISPRTKKMLYLGSPTNSFEVMRRQGIGINNSSLHQIPIAIE